LNRDIFITQTDEDILACFAAFKVLRPHLDETEFLPQVRRQQAQSYSILALRHNGIVKSVAGFRLAEFLAWGRILYVDDLVTLPGETGRGFAGTLLDWLIVHAHSLQCRGIHLDTGYTRHAAHGLYLSKGFKLSSHHMALDLGN
jgi:GNAT superfamily N-acetyltransferase